MDTARGDGRVFHGIPAINWVAGAHFTFGRLVCITAEPVVAGVVGTFLTEGVFNIVKATPADTWVQGTPLYVVPFGDAFPAFGVQTNPAAAQFAGYAWADTPSGATLADVKLNPGGKDVLG